MATVSLAGSPVGTCQPGDLIGDATAISGALVNDNSEFLCNPDQCLFKVKGDLVTQWQANIGLTFRF